MAVDVLAVVVFVVDVMELVHEENEFNSTADAIIAPPPFRKSRLVICLSFFVSVYFVLPFVEPPLFFRRDPCLKAVGNLLNYYLNYG